MFLFPPVIIKPDTVANPWAEVREKNTRVRKPHSVQHCIGRFNRARSRADDVVARDRREAVHIVPVRDADGEEVVFGGFRFSDEVERSGVRGARGLRSKARCVSRNCEIRERARAFGENRVEERRFRKLGVHAIVFVERKIAMARLSRG